MYGTRGGRGVYKTKGWIGEIGVGGLERWTLGDALEVEMWCVVCGNEWCVGDVERGVG